MHVTWCIACILKDRPVHPVVVIRQHASPRRCLRPLFFGNVPAHYPIWTLCIVDAQWKRECMLQLFDWALAWLWRLQQEHQPCWQLLNGMMAMAAC